MNHISDLKRKLFPKGVRSVLQRQRNKIFHRTTERSLTRSLKRLGIRERSVICIHAMLSGLGHIGGGPSIVIRAVQRAVPDSTIMMPSFPFSGSVLDHIKTDPVYDRHATPSQSGLLSETLRLTPGTIRSFHPTHPCVALGPEAQHLIAGSEKSQTPFGGDSTYGRFSSLENSILLLIHTNNTSLVHRVQECVAMPNLFLPEPHAVRGYAEDGRIAEYVLRIHVPVIPLYVVMPGDSRTEREYVWFPDYALLFPDYNRSRTLGKLRSARAKKMLLERHDSFVKSGVYRFVEHRQSLIASVQVKPWMERVCADVRQSIEMFPSDYGYENMQRALQQGLLSK